MLRFPSTLFRKVLQDKDAATISSVSLSYGRFGNPEVMSIVGTQNYTIVVYPERDSSPYWTPDTSSLLRFTCAVTGRLDVSVLLVNLYPGRIWCDSSCRETRDPVFVIFGKCTCPTYTRYERRSSLGAPVLYSDAVPVHFSVC